MSAVEIRPVQEDDLDALYEHQADAVAAEMAAFPSRDRATFLEHWKSRVLVGSSNYARVVLADGAVAGNIVSWIDPENGHRLFGYWLGREFWGRGVATEAVRLSLSEINDRPIYADVALHNIGSQRVLEKNGFVRESADQRMGEGADGIELYFYKLD